MSDFKCKVCGNDAYFESNWATINLCCSNQCCESRKEYKAKIGRFNEFAKTLSYCQCKLLGKILKEWEYDEDEGHSDEILLLNRINKGRG
jgi:hypothetical protein